MTPLRSFLPLLVLLGWMGSQALLPAPSPACDSGSETPKPTKAKGK